MDDFKCKQWPGDYVGFNCTGCLYNCTPTHGSSDALSSGDCYVKLGGGCSSDTDCPGSSSCGSSGVCGDFEVAVSDVDVVYTPVYGHACSSYQRISGGRGGHTVQSCANYVLGGDGDNGCIADYFYLEIDGGFCNCPSDRCNLLHENLEVT